VNKMSKSLGNAIGIHEPPLEMYGKIMSISDEMMWRYYELLTDVLAIQIEALRQGIQTGDRHPMEVKKSLARLIVTDFHSRETAEKAAEDWAKQFQKHEAPKNIEEATVETPENRIRIDKLLARVSLAGSVSEGSRLVKQGAVRVNEEVIKDPTFVLDISTAVLLRVGRKIKRVRPGIPGTGIVTETLSH
jgi:tyrosyl-tRNA synthetase